MGRALWDVEWRDTKLSEAYNAVVTEFTNAFMKESDANGVPGGGGPSSPHHAYFAAVKIKETVDTLDSILAGLKSLNLADSWRGPAAHAFEQIVNSYTRYIEAVVPIADAYRQNTLSVNQKHKAAYESFVPDEILNRYRTKHDDDFDDVRHVAYWYDYWSWRFWGVNGKSHVENLLAGRELQGFAKLYDETNQGYFGPLDTYLAGELPRLRGIRDSLAADYGVLYVQYDQTPAGPDFTRATRLVDPDSDDDDEKTDLGLDDAFADLSRLLNSGPGSSPGLSGLGGSGSGTAPSLSGLGDPSAAPGLSGLGDTPGGLGSGLAPGGDPGELGAAGVGGALGSGLPLVPGSTVPIGGGRGTVVTNPDGSKGIDLDGDGRADVGLDGGRDGGPRLVTGPDGTVGYDITGNDVPDLALDFHPLRGGDLPAGSALIVGADGSRSIDVNGDGIPDVTLDGRAIPGTAAPGGRLATGPDGLTGFDLTGDGIPDVGFDGTPMPSSQDVRMPDPDGLLPGQQLRLSQVEPAASALPAAGGYPMIPPMMGGMGGMGGGGKENSERERQTWLREDEKVWRDDVTTVTGASLGRPEEDDDEDSEPVDEWVAQPKRSRTGSRTPRSSSPQRGYQPGPPPR